MADDTQLDPKTLRRAACALESAGLITRKSRGNHTSRFFLNVNLLKAQADEAHARRLADKIKREASRDGASPFAIVRAREGSPTVAADADEDIYWTAPTQGGAR